MTNEFIFVYGSLRKEAASSMYYILARHCQFFAEGYLQGKLYEVDGYPGAIESLGQNDKVFGELYRINSRELVFSALDDYEECAAHYPEPHEYERKQVPISLFEGGSITAWVYLFNYNVSNLIQIESGDYLVSMKKKNQAVC